MVLVLAVVAILLLLGLLCCVVLVVFLWPARLRGGRDVALEFAHARFHLIDEPDILVIAHYAGLRVVVRVPYRSGTQADLSAGRRVLRRVRSRPPTARRTPCQTTWRTAAAAPCPRSAACSPRPRLARVPSQVTRGGCDADTFTRRRWVSTPVVDARIFVTRLTGGSTSVRSFSQLRPASTSASSGPHTEQLRAWAWKRFELSAGQNAIERVAEQAVKLVTLHSVTGCGLASHHLPIGTLQKPG